MTVLMPIIAWARHLKYNIKFYKFYFESTTEFFIIPDFLAFYFEIDTFIDWNRTSA